MFGSVHLLAIISEVGRIMFAQMLLVSVRRCHGSKTYKYVFFISVSWQDFGDYFVFSRFLLSGLGTKGIIIANITCWPSDLVLQNSYWFVFCCCVEQRKIVKLLPYFSALNIDYRIACLYTSHYMWWSNIHQLG